MMQTTFLTPGTPLPPPCAATIGFFDGVHRGHRYLISHVIDVAGAKGLEPAVVTFDNHPRQVLHSDYRPALLSTPAEKLALLGQTGAARCFVLHFDSRMAALPARQFIEDVLLGQLNVRHLVIGYDNRFGHDRAEGFDDYRRYGRAVGIDVEQWQPLEVGGVRVSSSVVRSLLLAGEVDMASRCLGYHYTVSGTVAHGRHVGTSLGFPTANIVPDDPLKLVPAAGVYAVEASIEGEERPLPAMLNIGTCPTFDGTATTIEAHVLDYSADLYGRRMGIAFVKRLRDERKFRTPAELASQLRHDIGHTREALAASQSSQPSQSSQSSQSSQNSQK